MKRLFDLLLTSVALMIGLVPIVLISIIIKLTSRGPVLYWSNRIGRNNRIFRMPKFRTMKFGSPEVASHLLTNPHQWLTPVGNFLRSTSLDELPQLWSILIGNMTFVGPRPALHNQDDLIALRTYYGVHKLTPGLTGWAQINGRDESSIPDKIVHDIYYLENHSFWFDLKVLALTFQHVIQRKGTSIPSELRGNSQVKKIPADAFLASAICWLNLHEFDRSISDYNRAIEMLPDNSVAYNNRGSAWTAKGEYEKAIDDYNAAITLDPVFTTAFHNRGIVWAEMVQGKNSEDDFAKVLDLIPEEITSHHAVVEYLTSGSNTRWLDDNGAVLVLEFLEGQFGWKPLKQQVEAHPSISD